MITIKQWENGETALIDETFEPVFLHPRTEIDHIVGNKLMAFRGKTTGIYLEPEFADVLEYAKNDTQS